MELNREQIIKALECWTSSAKMENLSCEGCYFETKGLCEQLCTMDLADVTLALIKELTEENKKLTINMNAYGLTAKNLAEENERLKKHKETVAIVCNQAKEYYNALYEDAKDILISETRVDTVRKMVAQIEENSDTCEVIVGMGKTIDTIYQITKSKLDQIAKEMLEEEK